MNDVSWVLGSSGFSLVILLSGSQMESETLWSNKKPDWQLKWFFPKFA